MEIKKTVLNDWHKNHGAKMIPFGGWDMPVQYTSGILQEHLATRKHGGLFDVSHMGRLFITGKEKMKFMQDFLTNDASLLSVGKAQYTLIQNENGGCVDDAYLYRIQEEEYLLVVNAGNLEKDKEWFNSHNRFDAKVEDGSLKWGMMSLQGPQSEKVLSQISKNVLPASGRNNVALISMCGTKTIVSRTGYTGEPVCFELCVPTEKTVEIWETILYVGKSYGIVPVGLGARDTLRLEASLPLYGHELGTDKQGKEIPVFASPLARFAVSFSEGKGSFLGKEKLMKQWDEMEKRKKGILQTPKEKTIVSKKVVPIAMTGKGVVREGYEVKVNHNPMGYLTSGTMVPFWQFEQNKPGAGNGMRSIGMAYVDSDLQKDTEIQVLCRDREIEGKIVTKNLENKEQPYAKPVLI